MPAATKDPPRSPRSRTIPTIPRVLLLNPDGAVIAGGTYTFSVQGIDTLGVTKIGYRSSGPSALTRSDSSLFSVPYPKNDTVTFSFTVPSSIPVGTTFTVDAVRARTVTGCGATATQSTVRVAAAGTDTQTPLAYQTVPPRMETGDSLDITGRDPDGLVKAIGYIVKDSTGLQVASVEFPISHAGTAGRATRRVERADGPPRPRAVRDRVRGRPGESQGLRGRERREHSRSAARALAQA